jgi:hypothetical protein
MSGRLQGALRATLCTDSTAFGLPAGVKKHDLSIRLAVPSFPSGTGRVRYEIALRGESTPRLVAQVAMRGREAISGTNPYVPLVDCLPSIEDLLVLPAGCMRIDGRTLYWAAWENWPALRPVDVDLQGYKAVFRRLRSTPWWPVHLDPALDTGMEARILRMLAAFSESSRAGAAGGRLELARESAPPFHYGFSHGDLWHQDVLVGHDERLRFIDWEWASEGRVAGTDLFELAVSTVGMRYRCGLAESLTRLLWGRETLETAFRDELSLLIQRLGVTPESTAAYGLAWLSILNERLCIQDVHARSPLDPGVGEALSVLSVRVDYVAPLYNAESTDLSSALRGGA